MQDMKTEFNNETETLKETESKMNMELKEIRKSKKQN